MYVSVIGAFSKCFLRVYFCEITSKSTTVGLCVNYHANRYDSLTVLANTVILCAKKYKIQIYNNTKIQNNTELIDSNVDIRLCLKY